MITSDSASIGISIRRTRKAARLTQKDLADLIDVSERTVRDIESGAGSPSLSSVIKAANALGLDIGIL